nr:integrase, catalytic region, zinc finger, CCHC-type, peptidase aspartic, catalytic [Tanacetum cinerariifolium]
MQTQTPNTLHNAIMEAGGKDRPPMLALGNYVRWKSRIKRYIDTKPNHELIHCCLKNPPYKFTWEDKEVLIFEGSSVTTTKTYMENYKNVSQDIRDQLNAKAKAKSRIKRYIDTKPNHELIHYCLKNPPYKYTWKDKDVPVTEGSSETTTERNQCNVTNHQVNVQFLHQLQPKWQRFVTLVKQSQELKTVSYHKLYDILKRYQNEVNKIRAERLSRTANLLVLVAQQQPVYHPQNHPTHYTQNSSTRSQQAATRNRGKAIVNSPSPIYDQKPSMVAEDDEMSKDKEIDKLMALISLSFQKIYKPTNNNLQTNREKEIINSPPPIYDQEPSMVAEDDEMSKDKEIDKLIALISLSFKKIYKPTTTTFELHQTPVEQIRHVARECQKAKSAKDAAYHREKMLLCKQDEAGIQLNAEQADWRDDTDDESEDQELEAHYMYMAQIQEVSPDAVDSGSIFDTEPVQKNDNDVDLANERELLASLIEKLKCEIDDSKNRNKFFETSNKVLVEKLKGDIEDFKNKNTSLKSSNSHFKEANNKLSETNKLMYTDLKKVQAELDKRNDVEYASKLVKIVLFIIDSGCSKHMMRNLKLLINFVEKFMGTVKFGNDQIAPILGYRDLVQGVVTIKRLYYVEGLNHNLFSVGQFCDADLEVAFRKSTCYILDLKENDLLTGSRRTDLYSITLQDTTSPNPICLMAKATSSQAWLWHRRLSHLNFDTINLLSKNDIVYTWTHFLRSKDETSKVLIDFLRLIRRGLHAQVRTVRTDKSTEFLNKTLHAYFAAKGIITKRPLLKHLNKMALTKDGTVHLLRLLEQC